MSNAGGLGIMCADACESEEPSPAVSFVGAKNLSTRESSEKTWSMGTGLIGAQRLDEVRRDAAAVDAEP
ncbi:MAG: hypothetical protein M3072_13775 [Candidatus Dormibacteraeota bacterium]|nr:hypothetical protein [Candidatus Dormibacteraeota bacterium]